MGVRFVQVGVILHCYLLGVIKPSKIASDSSKMSLISMQHDTYIGNVMGGIPAIQNTMALNNYPFGVNNKLILVTSTQ